MAFRINLKWLVAVLVLCVLYLSWNFPTLSAREPVVVRVIDGSDSAAADSFARSSAAPRVSSRSDPSTGHGGTDGHVSDARSGEVIGADSSTTNDAQPPERRRRRRRRRRRPNHSAPADESASSSRRRSSSSSSRSREQEGSDAVAGNSEQQAQEEEEEEEQEEEEQEEEEARTDGSSSRQTNSDDKIDSSIYGSVNDFDSLPDLDQDQSGHEELVVAMAETQICHELMVSRRIPSYLDLIFGSSIEQFKSNDQHQSGPVKALVWPARAGHMIASIKEMHPDWEIDGVEPRPALRAMAQARMGPSHDGNLFCGLHASGISEDIPDLMLSDKENYAVDPSARPAGSAEPSCTNLAPENHYDVVVVASFVGVSDPVARLTEIFNATRNGGHIFVANQFFSCSMRPHESIGARLRRSRAFMRRWMHEEDASGPFAGFEPMRPWPAALSAEIEEGERSRVWALLNATRKFDEQAASLTDARKRPVGVYPIPEGDMSTPLEKLIEDSRTAPNHADHGYLHDWIPPASYPWPFHSTMQEQVAMLLEICGFDEWSCKDVDEAWGVCEAVKPPNGPGTRETDAMALMPEETAHEHILSYTYSTDGKVEVNLEAFESFLPWPPADSPLLDMGGGTSHALSMIINSSRGWTTENVVSIEPNSASIKYSQNRFGIRAFDTVEHAEAAGIKGIRAVISHSTLPIAWSPIHTLAQPLRVTDPGAMLSATTNSFCVGNRNHNNRNGRGGFRGQWAGQTAVQVGAILERCGWHNVSCAFWPIASYYFKCAAFAPPP